MPYATDTVKMTVSGFIYGVQSWSTGLWFGTSNFPAGGDYGQTQTDGLRDSADLQGYWGDWWHTLAPIVSSAVSMVSVTYDVYEGATHAPHAQSVWDHTQPTSGSGPANPPEVAVVVSTRTATPGASGRGRSYLPCMGSTMAPANGGIDPAFTSLILGAYSTLLNAIASHNFDSDLGDGSIYQLYPSLASFKNGTNHPLTMIQVDSRFDVQRRRENKLASTRISAAV